MSQSCQVSIILPSYNQEELLMACLDSIRQNIPDLIYEVIVVDNHSSEGNVAMIKEKFPEAELIVNEANQGFSRAVNQGIKAARGEYLLLLNSDVILKKETIKGLVNFLRENPSIWAVGPCLLNSDGSIQVQGSIFGRGRWRSTSPQAVKFLSAACLMIKREVVQKVGLLDEKFFFYNEDLDYCLRIRKAGGQIYYLPFLEVLHKKGGSFPRKGGELLIKFGWEGGLYFCRKHYPAPIYQLYRGVLLLLAGGAGLFFWLAALLKVPRAKEKAKVFRGIYRFCWRGE